MIARGDIIKMTEFKPQILYFFSHLNVWVQPLNYLTKKNLSNVLSYRVSCIKKKTQLMAVSQTL
jgi:hypothetical protein